MRPTRQTIGVAVLGASVIYSAADLAGWLRPSLMVWRTQVGIRHTAAVVLGSLTFKALVLFTGALLAFWPARHPKP